MASVLSRENVSFSVLAASSIAGIHLASHCHEVLVCSSGNPIRSVKAYINFLQSAQYLSFKDYAETGTRMFVTDISKEVQQNLPHPTFLQLSKLRMLSRIKSAATATGLLVIGVQSCLYYQKGISKFEDSVVMGDAPIAGIADSSSRHFLHCGPTKTPALVLRLGSSARVAEMLTASFSNATPMNTVQPIPVLSSNHRTNQLKVAVDGASSGLSQGCYFSIDAAAKTLESCGVPPSARIIIQSGGLVPRGTVTADAGISLASRIRRSTDQKEGKVIVVHVACDDTHSTHSSSSPLAWADGGLLTVDGKAALVCGIISWVNNAAAPVTKKKTAHVIATSTKPASSSTKTLNDKKPTSASTAIVADPPLPIEDSEAYSVWFLVDSVGGAVRSVLVGAQGVVGWVSDAWVGGYTNLISSLAPLGQLLLPPHVPTLSSAETEQMSPTSTAIYIDFGDGNRELSLALSSDQNTELIGSRFSSIWMRRNNSSRQNTENPNIKGRYGGVRYGTGSLLSAILDGLITNGRLLHPISPTANVPCDSLVLVYRSPDDGGDAAALQLAKRYGQQGLKVCAITDALSFDDLDSTNNGDVAKTPPSGGALTACRDAKGVHSFCTDRVALGVWSHCCARLAAGATNGEIQAELQSDMACILRSKH